MSINFMAEVPQISRLHIIYLCALSIYFQSTPVLLHTVRDQQLLLLFFQILFIVLYNNFSQMLSSEIHLFWCYLLPTYVCCYRLSSFSFANRDLL
jgi:hypothetical protein